MFFSLALILFAWFFSFHLFLGNMSIVVFLFECASCTLREPTIKNNLSLLLVSTFLLMFSLKPTR